MNWSKAKWLPASLCILGGVAVAWHGNEGWGWFLFVAILFAIDW